MHGTVHVSTKQTTCTGTRTEQDRTNKAKEKKLTPSSPSPVHFSTTGCGALHRGLTLRNCSVSDSDDGLAYRLVKPCPREPLIIPFKEIEVSRDSIKLTSRLGAGNFGEVWQGKWNNRVDVAVKTLKEGRMSQDAFLAEAKIMHRLRHRKLVQLMGVCSIGEPMYIIAELMEHGSLLDYLRKDKGATITTAELLDMAAQVNIILDLSTLISLPTDLSQLFHLVMAVIFLTI